MFYLEKNENNEIHESVSKAEVLKHIEPKVKELMDLHLAKRKLWFSSDFLPADEKETEDKIHILNKLKLRARAIKDSARVALAMNLLTEEGLPHFHRLIAKHLGDESVWAKWNYMWTAEEDRHGNILRDYARDSRVFNFRQIEMMQFSYQQEGFNPGWDNDPYKVFVYTTLQERATQISHKNTGKTVSEEEPLLNGILSSIAADEARHFVFYRNMFKEILSVDPERALQAASSIMPAIDMPGHSMPHFREMADIIRREKIYCPEDYLSIVEEVIKYWGIEFLTGLNEKAVKAQDKILAIPARLKKIAEYIEQKSTSKSYSFNFIYDRLICT